MMGRYSDGSTTWSGSASNSSGSSSQTTNQSSNSRTSQSSSTSGSSTSRENATTNYNEVTNTISKTIEEMLTRFDIDTMSSAGRGAHEQLLAQLMAGGTDEQRRQEQDRLLALRELETRSADYTRDVALADAQGLMGQFLRQSLESAMPSILQAQVGAGTSGNAITALLQQDLSTRSAEGAAALGTKTVADYGQILAQLAGQRTSLIAGQEDVVTKALLQALAIDAGSVKRGTEATTRTSNTNTTANTTGTSVKEAVTNSSHSSRTSGSSSTSSSGSSTTTGSNTSSDQRVGVSTNNRGDLNSLFGGFL